MANKTYMALPFDVLDDAEDLTDEELGSLIRYMARYAETGEESGELTGAARYFKRRVIGTVDRFTDAAARKSESARKAAEARWNNANACDSMRNDANACERIPTQCDSMRNDATNTNTNTETKADTETKEKDLARVCEGESTDWADDLEKLDVPSICQSVCDEFNRLTNSRYSPQARYITDPVIELLKQGYTAADMLTVIGKKYREWNPTEMRGNIKPMTVLNAKKFGEYLAQPEIGPPKSKQRRQMEEMAAAIRNPFESEVMQIDSG